jgi:transcriptional regulator with XRE-family HTH domain
MNDEHEWLVAVGMRIRLGRVALRLTQNGLADRSGISRVTIGSIERGDHSAGIIVYRRLARALDIPLSKLLKEIEKT